MARGSAPSEAYLCPREDKTVVTRENAADLQGVKFIWQRAHVPGLHLVGPLIEKLVRRPQKLPWMVSGQNSTSAQKAVTTPHRPRPPLQTGLHQGRGCNSELVSSVLGTATHIRGHTTHGESQSFLKSGQWENRKLVY